MDYAIARIKELATQFEREVDAAKTLCTDMSFAKEVRIYALAEIKTLRYIINKLNTLTAELAITQPANQEATSTQLNTKCQEAVRKLLGARFSFCERCGAKYGKPCGDMEAYAQQIMQNKA